MRSMIRIVLAFLLLAAACSDDASSTPDANTTVTPTTVTPTTVAGQEVPLTIMPIGDSITQGESGSHTYRCYLDGMLDDAGVSFDFVGSRNHPYGGAPYEWACPTEFDQDHEGYWGGQVGDAIRDVIRIVEDLQPDIALIHLGTNDIAFGQGPVETAAKLESFVVGLQAVSPDITILVAQVIPCAVEQANTYFAIRCAEDLPAFNVAIDSFANLSTDESAVTVVDMETGFTHLKDEWHPTDAGDRFIAERWMKALQDIGVM